jgi:hypothetical protein
MPRNKISDLRDHLFAALEGLSDEEKPMDVERARAISDVAQTIINSAKVEIDLLRVVSGSTPGTDFLQHTPESRELPVIPERPRPQLAAGGKR